MLRLFGFVRGLHLLWLIGLLPALIVSEEQLCIDQSSVENIQMNLKKMTEIMNNIKQNTYLNRRSTQTVGSTYVSDLVLSVMLLDATNELVKDELSNLVDHSGQQESFLTVSTFELCSKMTKYSKYTKISQTCAEAVLQSDFKDDVFLLQLSFSKEPFCAYCMCRKNDAENVWTLIQRREDGSENFNRNWMDYKNGFGNAYGEYWIGLERIYAMTNDRPHELWISLKNYDDEVQNIIYSNFSIANEKEGYKLTVNGYEGRAGDSFANHNGMKFSTYDVKNDIAERNCAQEYKGGWWYRRCYNCNLNGIYYSYANQKTASGVNWLDWYKTSLKYTHMAIRPKS